MAERSAPPSESGVTDGYWEQVVRRTMTTDAEFTPIEDQPGTAVVPVKERSLVALGTLQANTPTDLITGATGIANQLATIIRKSKLASNIQGKEYVRVEGWTTLGALLGVVAREDEIKELDDGSFQATVSLVRLSDGTVVSRASSECGMDEPTWASRPRYARRSMAVTRATGKAARLAFSWIMALAGFEVTPAEEMPYQGDSENPAPPQARARAYPDPIDDAHSEAEDDGERKATERQVKLIHVRLKQAGVEEQAFLNRFHIKKVEELNFAQVNPALHWISGVAA